MPNTGSTKRRCSSSAEDGDEPPSKRLMIGGPDWSDLRPELIGHIARFLPMGTPDMMRLLLCVGPRVAAVVRKMYLTGNDYYLWYYECVHGSKYFGYDAGIKYRVKECIGYWVRYNEKAWKKRCLGKTHEDNSHSVLLTPEEIKSLEFTAEKETTLIYCTVYSYCENSALNEASLILLKKMCKHSGDLLLLSVGDKDVDDGLTALEEMQSMIDPASLEKDGKICLRFMRAIDALFAYPAKVIGCDLVDVLRFMIEEKIVKPDMWVTSLDEDGNQLKESLLNFALVYESIDCFRYLLNLRAIDINASSWLSTHREDGEERYEKIIHACFIDDRILPSYLEAVIACFGVDLDARNSGGETALCKGCWIVDDIGDQTIAKVRLLLEAGADPRIGDNDGYTPLSSLDEKLSEDSDGWNEDLKEKLVLLRGEILERIQELNNADGQNI